MDNHLTTFYDMLSNGFCFFKLSALLEAIALVAGVYNGGTILQ
jgi:hypothetical protein